MVKSLLPMTGLAVAARLVCLVKGGPGLSPPVEVGSKHLILTKYCVVLLTADTSSTYISSGRGYGSTCVRESVLDSCYFILAWNSVSIRPIIITTCRSTYEVG